MFWLKLRQWKETILPQFITSCRNFLIWQVDKIIAEDENRAGKLRNSAPIIFHDSSRAVLYAVPVNGDEFPLNDCSLSTLVTPKRNLAMCKRTSCAQVHELL